MYIKLGCKGVQITRTCYPDIFVKNVIIERRYCRNENKQRMSMLTEDLSLPVELITSNRENHNKCITLERTTMNYLWP